MKKEILTSKFLCLLGFIAVVTLVVVAGYLFLKVNPPFDPARYTIVIW